MCVPAGALIRDGGKTMKRLIVTKLVGRVVTGREMRSAHFMPVIAFDSFQLSKKEA